MRVVSLLGRAGLPTLVRTIQFHRAGNRGRSDATTITRVNNKYPADLGNFNQHPVRLASPGFSLKFL